MCCQKIIHATEPTLLPRTDYFPITACPEGFLIFLSLLHVLGAACHVAEKCAMTEKLKIHLWHWRLLPRTGNEHVLTETLRCRHGNNPYQDAPGNPNLTCRRLLSVQPIRIQSSPASEDLWISLDPFVCAVYFRPHQQPSYNAAGINANLES